MPLLSQKAQLDIASLKPFFLIKPRVAILELNFMDTTLQIQLTKNDNKKKTHATEAGPRGWQPLYRGRRSPNPRSCIMLKLICTSALCIFIIYLTPHHTQVKQTSYLANYASRE